MPGKTVIDRQSRAGGTSRSAASGRWQLRWGSVVTKWADPFDVCGPNGQRSSRVALVIDLEIVGRRLDLDAWLESPGHRRLLMARQVVDETVQLDGGLCHIDAALPDGGRLAVTLEPATGRLLYAQSSLLEGRGVPAGSFDPPTLQRVADVTRHNGFEDRSTVSREPSGEERDQGRSLSA